MLESDLHGHLVILSLEKRWERNLLLFVRSPILQGRLAAIKETSRGRVAIRITDRASLVCRNTSGISVVVAVAVWPSLPGYPVAMRPNKSVNTDAELASV